VSQTDSKQIYAQAKYGQYHGPVPKLKFYIKNYKSYSQVTDKLDHIMIYRVHHAKEWLRDIGI
jgi:hypothetical protein